MDVVLIVFEIITFAITFLGVLSAGYAYERSRNYIDLAVLILFVSIFTIDIIMTLEANFLSSPVLFGQATLTQVMLVVMATTFSWFVFYFKKWDSGYSVPFILGLFVILILVETGNAIPHMIFLAANILPASILLFRNGIKNKNGLTFALGLIGFTGSVSFMASAIFILPYLIRISRAVLLILGENGWIDDHLFVDKVKQVQIQSSWLASKLH